MDPSWQSRTGAAQRRKGRRLRASWRHEQQSIAQAVAVATHHSALRRQKTATAEATYDALRSQTTSVAGDTEFFSLYEEELGGTRPDRLYEVRPQERVQRRTVGQIVDNTLFLPTLDVPVPQMGNQLVDVCRLFDVLIPEQAIEVPKISPTPRPPRRRRVRIAEQTAEQFLVVEGETSVFKVCLPDRVLQRSLPLRNAVLSGLWSRSWILVRLVAAFKIFAQSRVLQRLLRVLVNTLVKGFFGLFPEIKKVRSGVRTQGRN